MEIYDVHLKHPFTMIISGPSGAGKSVWVKRLIERSSFVCKPPPKKIVYFYTEYQPLFSEISGVTFVQGLSENVIQKLGNEPTWIILDDLMDDASDSKVVSDLFTKVSHHRDISVILILQNFFVKGKQMRNITLNSSYIVLMKNPRDKNIASYIARQLYPDRVAKFRQIYEDVTKDPYSYIFIDLKANTPEEIRLLTHVLGEKEYISVFQI